MNGTILVAASNQKPALWKYAVTKSTAGSAVITKESQGPSGALTLVHKEIATAICHTVPHVDVATMQGNIVLLRYLCCYRLNRPDN